MKFSDRTADVVLVLFIFLVGLTSGFAFCNLVTGVLDAKASLKCPATIIVEPQSSTVIHKPFICNPICKSFPDN